MVRRLDNAKRLELEQIIERGQSAKIALSFFDDFEVEQKEKLWKAASKSDTQMVTALGYIALTAGTFKEYLLAAVADGTVAEKDLQMEVLKNG